MMMMSRVKMPDYCPSGWVVVVVVVQMRGELSTAIAEQTWSSQAGTLVPSATDGGLKQGPGSFRFRMSGCQGVRVRVALMLGLIAGKEPLAHQ